MMEPKPLHRRLGQTAAGNAGAQMAIALVVAALASSRAPAHVLTAGTVVAIVAVAAATSGLVGWLAGTYGGAAEVLSGVAELECSPHCPAAPSQDPWVVPRLWRAALRWAAVNGMWALAGAGLVAVVLNGQRAGLTVLFVTVAGLSGCAAVLVDTVARHQGAHAARRLLLEPPVAVPLRRRAWREMALPLALVPTVVSTLFAWVLFHDYRVHQPFAAKALTRSVALADVPVTVVVLIVIFTVIYVRPWAEVDARLGRIALDDPPAQAVPHTSPIGYQGIVYTALAGWLFAVVVRWILPAEPTLIEVMLARGLYAGVLTFAFTGVAYTRGAINALAGAEKAAA